MPKWLFSLRFSDKLCLRFTPAVKPSRCGTGHSHLPQKLKIIMEGGGSSRGQLRESNLANSQPPADFTFPGQH